MSTRATIHFYDKLDKKGKPTAIIYRHNDGYPEGLGNDLIGFLNVVKEQCGTKDWIGGIRFSDPCYLSAKWVVWDAVQAAMQYHAMYDRTGKYENPDGSTNYDKVQIQDVPLMRFLSVGILEQDPWDIEYRYIMKCYGEKDLSIVCEKISHVYGKKPDGTTDYDDCTEKVSWRKKIYDKGKVMNEKLLKTA